MQRVRKDDRVRVMSGKDRGREGRVVRVFPKDDRVLVEGVNYVKKHEPLMAAPGGAQQGGIIETEAPIHISTVMPVCPSCDEPVRVGFVEIEEGDPRSKTRVCRRCDAQF